ncbi:MAG TPA: bifunctional transaldolase/phosoglucose isomerase [Solirubrobacteraceae bacterium]|jgi:transaldolase/glucose-6-phosphate isomerase|nr:bifunctional transaldolase/phosoglucose isomerase [Solirubrobacteraceae bacterium]
MSATEAQVNPHLAALVKAGTSPWLDQIRRTLVEGGELARMVREESLRGVTSNPSIFEKAILGSTDYDDELEAAAREHVDAGAIYERLAMHDVQAAADVLSEIYGSTHHHDGFVSMEVAPELAHDSEGTLTMARSYWQRLSRPNVMIKIPGTREGAKAIEEAISEGINVNVTLLFAVEAYERVAEAYLRGLERRLAAGESLEVSSVASFFVSRVDTAVDKQLEQLGHQELKGKAAIANARNAYRRFKEIFSGPRWEALHHAGATVQRPLWASTGVKNPAYPDTMYVDELVGPHTVNTMPLATLLAVADHGHIHGPTAEIDASEELEALAKVGIDLGDVTEALLVDGIEQFEEAMRRLLEGIESRRAAVVTGRPPTIQAALPSELQEPVAARVKKAMAENVAQRIWRRDPTLWAPPGTPEIEDRLGWLTVSETMLEHAPDLREFAEQCVADGFTDAVLLGMGGSSLGPEVIRRSFGSVPGGLTLHVLDSTHPDAIAELEETLTIPNTLFIVSSKSGSTIETLSHYRYFKVKAQPRQFAMITDPGSPLERAARDGGLRRCFLNPPDIGGRYSVLSYFGLVPAALMAVNIEALLHRCQVAEQNCAHYDSSKSNSGLWLGAVLGELALQGRDKLTFVVSEPIQSFGLWAEQLIAESTGKNGRGIVPVIDEPLGSPEVYGEDRVFAYLRDADEPNDDLDDAVEALARAGHPTLTMATHGPVDLGRIFFLAEFATAVAGWALEINPFDQPNVQEAKDNTGRVLQEGVPEIPVADDEALRALLGDAGPPHYISILGYLRPSAELDAAVADLRGVLRAATGAATTFGYGPRYLHSTGQLHKGGPPVGRFLQLVSETDGDLEIPGAGFTFGTLIAAQAAGDLETLRAHGVPAERVKLEGDGTQASVIQAVRSLTGRLTAILGSG